MSDHDDEKSMNPAAFMALLQGDFENAETAMTPGGIPEQERQAQEDMVERSDRIPREMRAPDLERKAAFGGLGKTPEEALLPDWEEAVEFLEDLGFDVGGVADNDLFVDVELPEGWSIEPRGHNMWSDIIDDSNYPRAGLFYKGAFYDEKAHLTF